MVLMKDEGGGFDKREKVRNKCLGCHFIGQTILSHKWHLMKTKNKKS